MCLDIASGTEEVAAQVPQEVALGEFPSWVLHLPSPVSPHGTLYFKPSYNAAPVHMIQLGSGTHSTAAYPAQGPNVLLMACTGGSKLVV